MDSLCTWGSTRLGNYGRDTYYTSEKHAPNRERQTLLVNNTKKISHNVANEYFHRRVRSQSSGNFWEGLFGTPQKFVFAQTTILGPNPYDFFPRVNNTASLFIFQEYDTSEYRTVTDAQDAAVLGGLSNVGGMLTFGETVLSLLLGLSLLALLDLEDFSLFAATPEGRKDEGQSKDADASAGSGGDDSGGSGACRRVGHDPSEESAVPLLPSGRN